MEKQRVIFFWSGGKDSALALYKLRQDPKYQVICLLSTLNKKNSTINLHGVKDSLLVQQAALLSLPLQRVYLEDNCSNEEYIDKLSSTLLPFKNKGISTLAFGDINLVDIKEFKDKFAKELGLTTIYPLWGQSTKAIAEDFFRLQFKAVITSVRKDVLERRLIGKEYNQEFIDALPENVDPCGENGEFHTFVNFAPGFRSRVQFSKAMPLEEEHYFISYLKDN